jgi:hypothetical protein
MMKRVTSSFLPTIAALVALFVAGWSQAAVITVSYVNGVVSSTSNFAAGTTTSVSLASGIVNMSPGQTFFRFGVALSVNNPNPEFNTAYAADANSNYGVTYPANLGFVTLGMSVGNTDAAGASVAPLNNAGKTRALFNNTPWTGATGDQGDVTAGAAGSPSSLFKGLSPAFDPTNPGNVSVLGTLGAPGANFINSLPYSVGATGATLTPSIKLSDTSVWTRTVAGVAVGGTEANFGARSLNLAGSDSVVMPSVNNGGITIVVPEPATMSLIGLGMLGLLARRRTA